MVDVNWANRIMFFLFTFSRRTYLMINSNIELKESIIFIFLKNRSRCGS